MVSVGSLEIFKFESKQQVSIEREICVRCLKSRHRSNYLGVYLPNCRSSRGARREINLGENKTESVAKKTTRTRRTTESSRTHKEMSDGEKIALATAAHHLIWVSLGSLLTENKQHNECKTRSEWEHAQVFNKINPFYSVEQIKSTDVILHRWSASAKCWNISTGRRQ